MDNTTNDSTKQTSKRPRKQPRKQPKIRVYWRGDYDVTPLARTVSQLMLARGLTPATLEDKSGVSRATIYNILTKRRYSPTTATLSEIAGALGVTPGELLDGITGL